MSSIKEIAAQFVDACDSGRGWETCRQFCHERATFAVQADALADVVTLEAYTEWAKSLLGPIPDASYELQSLTVDEESGTVCGVSVFQGTNTGEGPVPPTGNRIESDYVYVMQFESGRIRHVTKIWNDGYALRQLGWA
jgi:predicted ester cyclase